MSKISFENFGYVSGKSKDFTISASRYLHQKQYEQKILSSIMNRLSINKEDEVLDVGCNVGTHIIPLYFFVKEIYGIDHKTCLKVLKKRLPEIPSKNLISGNFLSLKISNKFDKILCYSVLQYLKNDQEVIFFVTKLIKVLKKNGIALLGDIPNIDLKNSFLKSKVGKKWLKKFNLERKKTIKKHKIESISYHLKNKKKDEFLVKINNNLIQRMIREIKKRGFKVRRIKQPTHFLYGPTREDIIIYK